MAVTVDTVELEAVDAPSPAGMRRTLILFGLAAVFLVASAIILSQVVGQPAGAIHTIVIPQGTADRVASGDEVDLIPPDLELKLRDTLILVNNDNVMHTVGAFTIGAGERIETRMSQVASFSGFCSLHPSGAIEINVSTT